MEDDPVSAGLLLMAGAPATALAELYVAGAQASVGASQGAVTAQQAAAALGSAATGQGVMVMFAIDTVVEGSAIQEIFDSEG